MQQILRVALLAITALAIASPAQANTSEPEAKTYRVYFLGGQSNMDGYGFTADLPPELTEANEDIRIFTGQTVADGEDGGGVGLWQALSPGHGTGFSTDGETATLSERFGPELTFATQMARARPGERIALIKFSRGGTGLVNGVSGYGSWDPAYDEGNRRNQYDNALTAIAAALSARDIDGDGVADRLVPSGIVWMQGEADAFDNWAASREYDVNLARLMSLLRASLHNNDLPVVIGRIKDSGDTAETRVMKYSLQVRAAQGRFVEADRCAALVTASDTFGFIDGWHYRSQDYLALGTAFAEAMRGLEDGC